MQQKYIPPCGLAVDNTATQEDIGQAAPALLRSLRLALAALIDQPDLRQIAISRGMQTIRRATGQDNIQPNDELLTTLQTAGIVEPTLSELTLTTTLNLARGWIAYAQQNGLGNGFIVTQLRLGKEPPITAKLKPKRWYSDEEVALFIK